MSWFELVKADPTYADILRRPELFDRRVQRTGSCWRCNRIVSMGDECPLNLPAPPTVMNCPMKEAKE